MASQPTRDILRSSPGARSLPVLAPARFEETVADLSRGRALPRWVRSGPSSQMVLHNFEGQLHRVALPVTFTPFASARACSARCVFCSETLRHRGARRLSASLRPGPRYFAGLSRALAAMRGLPIGVSLSGLEATDDRAWLFEVLRLLRAHAQISPVGERVLYTNFIGFCREPEPLVAALALESFAIDRVEISRHDVDGSRNQAIMRIRPEHQAAYQSRFEEGVRSVAVRLPLRLVCVIQARGVSSVDAVIRYLDWSASLGIADVVFRELSALGEEYLATPAAQVASHERVSLGSLMAELWPRGSSPRAGFEPEHATDGYYFFNLVFRYRKQMRVTFECSDYRMMKERHASDVIYKLVFHADGRLGADWDPDQRTLIDTER